MSVFTEIQRIKNAKEAMKNALTDKGISVPSSAQLDDLPEYINKAAGGVEMPRCVESITLDDNGFPITLVLNGNATTIPDGCFAKSTNLKSISMPSVTSIGYSAFSSCSSLVSVDIPSGVTSIGYNAFYSCTSLTSIDIPSGVTSIGSFTFFSCTSLTSVTCRATTPPANNGGAFADCPNLTNIYVPASSVNAYKTASGWSEYASKFTAIQ